MSLQNNTTELQAILAAVNALPEAGGGSNIKVAYGTFTPEGDADEYIITHNLGVVPQVAICLSVNPTLSNHMIAAYAADVGIFGDSIVESNRHIWSEDVYKEFEDEESGETWEERMVDMGWMYNSYPMTSNNYSGFSNATATTIKLGNVSYADCEMTYYGTYIWVMIGGIE